MVDDVRDFGHAARMRILVIPLAALALSGCVTSIAKTAVEVVSLPVKVVGKGVDAATTSQAEADEKRGRALRKSEEDYGKRVRLWAEACDKLRQAGELCPPKPVYQPPVDERQVN